MIPLTFEDSIPGYVGPNASNWKLTLNMQFFGRKILFHIKSSPRKCVTRSYTFKTSRDVKRTQTAPGSVQVVESMEFTSTGFALVLCAP